MKSISKTGSVCILLCLIHIAASFPAEARQMGSRGAARSSVGRPSGGGGGGGGRRSRDAQRPQQQPSRPDRADRGDRGDRGDRTNINNKNVNINHDVDINVDAHGGGYYGGGYYNDHPIATTVAVTAAATMTAYAIGSMLTPSQVPSTGCLQVMKNNVAYMQCGTTWLQPQYQGTNVTYIVVAAP